MKQIVMFDIEGYYVSPKIVLNDYKIADNETDIMPPSYEEGFVPRWDSLSKAWGKGNKKYEPLNFEF